MDRKKKKGKEKPEVRTYVDSGGGFGLNITHTRIMLRPKSIFMVTRINHADHLIHPDTNLSIVKTNDVLLSADARIKIVTMILIRSSNGDTLSLGTLYMCFPKPSFTAIVDIMAGASTAS